MKRTRDKPDLAWAHDLCAMVQIGLICYGVGGAFLNLAIFDLYYTMLAFVVVTTAIVRKELAEASTPVPASAPARSCRTASDG